MPDLPSAAARYAAAGLPVLPLAGKAPRTRHGFRDASCEQGQVASWWRRWPVAGIGVAVPAGIVVVDVDPRGGGVATMRALAAAHGRWPPTRTCATGGGGWHLWYAAAGGEGWPAVLGPGVDVKHAGRGYVVVPPSVHPSGGVYAWRGNATVIAAAPRWLVELMAGSGDRCRPTHRPSARASQDRPGDRFNAERTWADVLAPHGWRLVRHRGEVEHWAHAGATCALSATVNALGTDRLHVFTTSTPLRAGTSYSRFGAYAALDHHGDHAAAARHLGAAERAACGDPYAAALAARCAA